MAVDRARGATGPTLTVCVVTYERPEFLGRCLDSLATVADDLHQVVVVDASDTSHEVVTADRPALGLTYVWAPHLAGWMTRSRNEALRHVSGDVVAFLDDDVIVTPGWAAAIRDAFADPTLAAAAGRTLNGHPGEESYPLPIGRLRDDGTLTDGFAAETPGPVEIDHGIGANMAFRRSLLAELGGFRDDYPGTAMREDTDIFLRVRRLRGRAVFLPAAVVHHRPAPHVKGERFDRRYELYGRRNHVVLLARDAGLGSPVLLRWAVRNVRQSRTAKRAALSLAGIAWGMAAALRQARWAPLPPRREDAAARAIRAHLSE